MNNYVNAGDGLRKMFIASVGMIVCTVLMLVPLVNFFAGIGSIVFVVVSLIGLNSAGKDIAGCKTAFVLTIIQLVLGVVGAFLDSTGMLYSLLDIAGEILTLLVTYFVCTSVADVMREIQAFDVADKGIRVWKINLGCTIATVILGILVLVPGMNVLAAVAAIVVAIISLVGSILYMMFLSASAAEFGSY